MFPLLFSHFHYLFHFHQERVQGATINIVSFIVLTLSLPLSLSSGGGVKEPPSMPLPFKVKKLKAQKLIKPSYQDKLSWEKRKVIRVKVSQVWCHTRTLNWSQASSQEPKVTRNKKAKLKKKKIHAKGLPCKNVISGCVFPDCENRGTKLMGRNVCCLPILGPRPACFLYLDKCYRRSKWKNSQMLSLYKGEKLSRKNT